MYRFEIKNLSNLNQKEIDFYNFCIENVDFIFNNSLPDVCKKFGAGVSFLYHFLEKLKFKSFKEFVYYLGFLNGQNYEKSDNKNEFEFIYKIMQESNLLNLQLFNRQIDTIDNLCGEIFQKKRFFCLGFGYSKVALSDLLGFFNKWNDNFYIINDERVEYLSRLKNINKNDILLIYSMRSKDEKLFKWIDAINEKTQNKLQSFLVTSNTNSKLCTKVKNVIEIDNIMKRVDSIQHNSLVSPIIDYACFNNFLKTNFYTKYKKELRNQKNILDEIDSWFI